MTKDGKADAGDTEMQYQVGTMLSDGDGVKVDKKQAKEYLAKAMKSRHFLAACQLIDLITKSPDGDESELFKQSYDLIFSKKPQSWNEISLGFGAQREFPENILLYIKYLEDAGFSKSAFELKKYSGSHLDRDKCHRRGREISEYRRQINQIKTQFERAEEKRIAEERRIAEEKLVAEEKKFQNTSVSYPLKNKFKLNIKLYKYFFSGMSEDYAFFLAKKNGSKIEKKGSNLFVNDDGRKIILRLASIDNSTIISGVSFTLSSVALEALKEKYSKEFPDGKWERKKDGKINRQWIEGVYLVIHLNNITETMIESGAIVVLKSIDVKTVINDPLNRLSAQEKQMMLNLTVSSMPTSQVVISVTDRAIEKFLSEQSEMKKHEQQKQQLNF